MFLIEFINTSAAIVWGFILNNMYVLNPDSVDILLRELQFVFGALQDYSRVVNPASCNEPIFLLIVALQGLEAVLGILVAGLYGCDNPTLMICREVAHMTIPVIRSIIRILNGG